jgi:chemotaxis methyl-accepting protein methylase/chemotaxis response regulator CheB/signal transduction histidine kinase
MRYPDFGKAFVKGQRCLFMTRNKHSKGSPGSQAREEGRGGNPGATEMPKTDNGVIVGIGASAGGLDALQKVLPGLPAKAGLVYVIVQHMAPKPPTLLPSLLAKHTAMPVETISDGMAIQPDTLYITPPNKDVKLSGNLLQLGTVGSKGPKPSIDYFFSSLAEEKKMHAVGIILSGSGSDGALGIRAIKSNDGITMAQTVDTAKFFSMPQAAIETGLVDLVVPPEKIGRELEAALKYPDLIAKVPLDAHMDGIKTILEMLHQHTGVDFSDYKATGIHRRIRRRMVFHKLYDLQGYVAYVSNHPGELSILYKDLIVSVTRFFQDPEAFEALSVRLRELLERHETGAPFRVWVPGCSSGEEAFSIAMLIAEVLGPKLDQYTIQIFATDIDEDSIQRARKGIYPLSALWEADDRRFEKYFSHIDYGFKVNKAIRDMVVLARQDLFKDTPFLHLDLISCRNLLIDINDELQDKVLSLFQYSLNPGGLLFLGKSESISRREDLFETVDAGWNICRRKEVPIKQLPALIQVRHNAREVRAGFDVVQQQQCRAWRESAIADALVGMLGGCAVLTDEHGNINYTRGDVSPYFKIPEGCVKDRLNALEMCRPEFRFILQSLIHKSRKEKCAVAGNCIVDRESGAGVQIRVGPVQGGSSDNYRLIVIAPAAAPRNNSQCACAPAEDDRDRILELEQELDATREHLQDTIEELETTTEELQSLNEEMQSANEELQASNEELETSNEELQASNEELNTLNDELRAKSGEVNELLEDLKISERKHRLLVDNMNEAVMLCELAYNPDNRPIDLLIRQSNPALEQLISIHRDELPIRAEAAHLKELVSRNMLEQLRDIAKGGDSRRFELHLGDLDLHLTVSAYSLGDERLGIVCHDETERKRIQASLKELNESLEQQVAERTELAEARAKQLQNLSVELIEAEERERRRVAELLHDDLQQLLATARLQLQAARPDLRDDPELAAVEKILVASIRKSRRLSHELSPPVLHHAGLIAALKWLTQQMEAQFGLTVDLETQAEEHFEASDLKVFLFRAAQELLFNVVKHAGIKSARLRLAASGRNLVLAVEDEGQGFDPCMLDASSQTGGFGLLSLKARASHIGGALDIQSIPGKGSRFALTAPCHVTATGKARSIVPESDHQADAEAQYNPAADATGLRVLFVDDHKVMRQGLIRLIAGQHDITVVGEASDGLEAIEQTRRLHPDVVVMDVSMPKVDGVEATRRIKQQWPAVRVIGLSMFDDDHISHTMREAGAETFVSKTASSAELLRAIYGMDHQSLPHNLH